MEQDVMLRSNLLLVAVMWIGALIVYVIFRKMKKKINDAQRAEDMPQFRSEAAKKALNATIKYQRALLVLIVITAVFLILTAVSRISQLVNGNALPGLSFFELLFKLANPNILLGFFFIVGFYITAIIFISYLKVLIQKCKEMGLAEKE